MSLETNIADLTVRLYHRPHLNGQSTSKLDVFPKVRTVCPTATELRAQWVDPVKRCEIIQPIEERGMSFAELADAAKQPEADPFDMLCHLPENPRLTSVDRLVLKHPFPTPEGMTRDWRDEMGAMPGPRFWSQHHKESIYVVRAPALIAFMEFGRRHRFRRPQTPE